MRDLLRHRDFRLLLAGQTMSMFGDWLLILVMAMWAKELTGSNGVAGSVLFAMAVPNLLAPLGGWLADRIRRRPLMITTLVELGYPNPRGFASALVVAAVGWGLWKGRRSARLGDLAVLGGWSVFAYFMCAMAVHENHGYLLAPMLALAAVLRPGWGGLAAWLAVTMALTLNAFYGLGDGVGWAVPRRAVLPDVTVWLSVAHVALFAAYARRLARSVPGDAT